MPVLLLIFDFRSGVEDEDQFVGKFMFVASLWISILTLVMSFSSATGHPNSTETSFFIFLQPISFLISCSMPISSSSSFLMLRSTAGGFSREKSSEATEFWKHQKPKNVNNRFVSIYSHSFSDQMLLQELAHRTSSPFSPICSHYNSNEH